MKDTLFLLAPGFRDGDGSPYYCPYCMIFEGLLRLYPQLTTQLDVRRVEFPRPRPEIVTLLGSEHQSCPVLILNQPALDLRDNPHLQKVGDLHFLDDPEAIGNYLSSSYGIPRPH